MKALRWIPHTIDGITMYRVLIYGLGALVVLSFTFSFIGLASFNPFVLGTALVTLVVVSLVTNIGFAKLTKAPVNHESTLITAFILFFLINHEESLRQVMVLSLVAFGAIASKYILAVHKHHIVNPAAFGAVLLGMFYWNEPTWWIGSFVFFVPMALVGAAIIWKIRRFQLFFSFFFVGLITFYIEGLAFGDGFLESLSTYLFSWPTLFMGAVMLTEPLTTPPTKRLQIVYGALVGFLMNTSVFSGFIVLSPELALVIGNILAYPFILKKRFLLTLTQKREIASHTFEFIFQKPKGFTFSPGQYLEWTLPHKNPDKRGIRRYFTIASAPTEDTVRLGVKFSEKGSSFKEHLRQMEKGDGIYATQLSGDFILPHDVGTKCVFIAGGIGVTPFRSMLQQVIDAKDNRDVVLFYANRTPNDIAYTELLKTAEDQGVKVVHLISESETAREGDETGYIDTDMLKRHVPQYMDRTYYLSGPHAMVVAYKKMLRKAGVPRSKIICDYFPGLA